MTANDGGAARYAMLLTIIPDRWRADGVRLCNFSRRSSLLRRMGASEIVQIIATINVSSDHHHALLLTIILAQVS